MKVCSVFVIARRGRAYESKRCAQGIACNHFGEDAVFYGELAAHIPVRPRESSIVRDGYVWMMVAILVTEVDSAVRRYTYGWIAAYSSRAARNGPHNPRHAI